MDRKKNRRFFPRTITMLCLFLEMFVRQGEGTTLSGPKRLAEDLFREYGSPIVRPVKDPNKTVEVFFRAKPVWFADFRWTDEYLTWDPDNYNGTEELSVVKRQIWFPDLAASEKDLEAQENVLKKNGVWFVSDIAIEEKLIYYLCCPEPYSEVHYTLHVQRESGFYVINFGVPTLLLSLTTVAVFLLHPESGEKISLCVNNVLALVIFQQLLAATYYFVVVITISFLSVLSTSLTLGMYHHTGSRPLPKLLRLVLFMKESGHQQSSYSRVQAPKNRNQTDAEETRREMTDIADVELSTVTKPDVDYPDNNVDRSAGGRSFWRSSKRGRNSVGASPGLVPVDISKNDVTSCVTDMSFQEEWKKAARRIDKCLFYISLAMMMAAVIFCLFEFMKEKRKE
ncbi:Neuronal acetylcholine receptor subunit alpha-7 [Holothuria leucospilota]|uniref:Neuronal acetylcholine receptor subunit alpha-7 n=1 Tax=Holothuria leucospilota TaxID=206669 RepID=A0A9Q1CFJ3_HOLLE|nr:Neuronal acetylcholine receptor subunit alpha-7 [Holothuria leucospilota]